MKTYIFLSIFFILLTDTFVFGQNWAVINSSEKFNFKPDGVNIITSTIWTDSIKLNGSDTVLFLNRILCDTCVTLLGGPSSCDTCYGLMNSPQFLQRQIRKDSNGIYYLTDTGNLVIHSLANLNDIWIFDSTNNIQAQLITITSDSIFGFVDSVKTILLSTSDTIKLSKNSGIILFPAKYGINKYYRLVGIEGRNSGELVPKFADFFSFDVGDMFEYEIADYTDECVAKDEIFKYTIDTRHVAGNQYDFTYHGYRYTHAWNHNTLNGCGPVFDDFIYVPENMTLSFTDSTNHFANKFNGEFFRTQPCANWDTTFGRISNYNDSNGIFIKSFGIHGEPGVNNASYYFYIPINFNNNIVYSPGLLASWDGYSNTYSLGLGLTSIDFGACFEGVYEEHMTAFKTAHDSAGIFTPDSFFTVGINSPKKIVSISLFPNPAMDFVNIVLSHKIQGSLFLTDLEGRELFTQNITSDEIILDLNFLYSGIYLVRFVSTEGVTTRKIIIQH